MTIAGKAIATMRAARTIAAMGLVMFLIPIRRASGPDIPCRRTASIQATRLRSVVGCEGEPSKLAYHRSLG
jgi:hypothetical protein